MKSDFDHNIVPINHYIVSDQSTVIFPGTHTYNFSCILPQQLPTSYEGAKGYIRYTIRVALERPWKFDHTYRVGFTVLKPIDLNLESPVLRYPSQGEVIHTFCCGPCKSPPMSIKVSLPQSGYVPGQTVALVADISNQSRIKVEMVKFILQQVIHYHSSTPHNKTLEEVNDICQQIILTTDDKELNQLQQNLVIPAVPPTISKLSRVININYELKVEVKVRGAHVNPVVRIPLTIGTYPLVNYQPISVQGVTEPSSWDVFQNTVQPIVRPLSNATMHFEDLRKYF